MKRLLVLLLLLPLAGLGQRVPDNEEILVRTIDQTSPYYYPVLMERYMKGDTTLTVDDYHYLYYGYALQDEYRPLEPVPGVNEQLSLLSIADAPDSTQLRELIAAAGRVMERDPFSPQNLNFLVYAYGMLGDTINERINYDRFSKVLSTIRSSGSGTKESSPWHVLMFSHASDVLGAMGLQIVKRQVRSKSVEYIQLTERDEAGNRGYFFDFGRVYSKRPEKLPPKRERTWKLNDYPLGGKKRGAR